MSKSEKKHSVKDLQIVLLGKTGSGKSASGNTIIGGDKEAFEENSSAKSGTKICRSAQTVVDGQKINVIDTIGLSDTKLNETKSSEKIKIKIEQLFDCTEDDGIDVFLLIIKLGDTFSEEQQNTVKWIQDNFGAKASKYTLVLFTYGDKLHEPVEKYLSRIEKLRSVVDMCSGGYHVFKNKDKDPSQVTELLKKIEILRMKNAYSGYHKQDYWETQREIQNAASATTPEATTPAATTPAIATAATAATAATLAFLFYLMKK